MVTVPKGVDFLVMLGRLLIDLTNIYAWGMVFLYFTYQPYTHFFLHSLNRVHS